MVDNNKDVSLETLVKMAYDTDPNVRIYAAEQLGNLDHDLAYQVLLELSNDKDNTVKEAAKKSIERYKQRYYSKNPNMVSPILSTINQIISKQQESIEEKIEIKPEEEKRDFDVFTYVYQSLDRYREQPQIMKKHYENFRTYLLKELDLIYELIEHEDAFDITKIRNKMKISSTGELTIKSMEIKEFVEKKNKKKISMYRLIVDDKYGREGVVYVNYEIGQKLSKGDVIKVLNCEARTIKGTDETAIWTWDQETVIWKKL